MPFRPAPVLALMLTLGLLLVPGAAAGFPSCDGEVAEHCAEAEDQAEMLGCLTALDGGRSAECDAYIAMNDKCADELESGGVCGNDNANGEGLVCIIQRTKPDLLSEGCRETLPREEDEGLRNTFWKAGKRMLDEDEQEALNEEDLELYQRWEKKKKKKSGAGMSQVNKDREYAVKSMRRGKLSKGIISELVAVGTAALAKKPDSKKYEVRKPMLASAKKQAKSAEKKDKRLGSFTGEEINELVDEALKKIQFNDGGKKKKKSGAKKKVKVEKQEL